MNRPWRPARIDHHGFISDGQTAALIHRDATVDWLCLPRFDSEACFAALLGDGENGGWWLAPEAETTGLRRRYLGNTLVLETLIETEAGAVAITDFMPIRRTQTPDLIRIVEGRRGQVEMVSRLALRFDNGRTHPLIRSLSEREAVAIAGPNAVALRCDVPIEHEGRHFISRFTVTEGEQCAFALTWFPSHGAPPDVIDPKAALERTRDDWEGWAAQARFDGPRKDMVTRSLLLLRGLIHAPTGGILAAATTALPERPGGHRNWDYRFCWLRDATFALLAFMEAGYDSEARAWIDRLRRAIAGAPIDVQPFYTVDAGRAGLECEAAWLAGFGGAKPVNLGNSASSQCQLDIYGEVLDAIFVAARRGLAQDSDIIIRLLAEKLESIWRGRDAGIWESRGAPKHHTYSKAMCWVAFDRAARWMERRDAAEAGRWRGLADEAKNIVLRHGFDEHHGTFTRAFADEAREAAVLRLPLVGFIDAHDERMVRTVAAIERDLLRDGYVWRYSTDMTDDGVGGEEGAFLAVGCWLADVYAMQGRLDDASALFARVCDAANDLGILSEEFWVKDGRQLGNFPQALSHVALVNTAMTIASGGKPPRLNAA